MQARRWHLVEVLIAAGLRDGGFVKIDTGHVRRSTQHGSGEPNPPDIAAQIEHPRIFYQPGESQAVVTLVAEEAGLVSFHKSTS